MTARHAEELSEYEKWEKERFDSAPTEVKVRLANAVNDQLFQTTSAKLATLPAISAIAAALLVVASFNPKLLPLTTIVKLLISILMLIVPASLFFYVRLVHKVERFGERLLTHVYKVPLRRDANKIDMFTYELPRIVSLLIFDIVLIAVYVIWFGS